MSFIQRLFGRQAPPPPPRDPFWSQFEHAYGQALDMPGLLERLSPSFDDPVWPELWSRLCHQESVYSASAASMPALIGYAARLAPGQRTAPLCLAASIAAHIEPRQIPDVVNATYHDSVRLGASLALESLETASVSEGDFVVYLQAYAAFRGDLLFGRWLDSLIEGELELECPGCDAFLWVHPTPPAHVATEDLKARGSLLPPEGTLPESAQALQALARSSGYSSISEVIAHAYGTATCPTCSRVFIPAIERARQDKGVV